MSTKPSTNINRIRRVGNLTEYRVQKNGLRVLLGAFPELPVAVSMVTYHVGSRNEVTGTTGATHLLEHLMFKGSKSFNKKNKKDIWRLLEQRGVVLNATTWFDRTNYYFFAPTSYLQTMLSIESDRMRHALFSEQDKRDEMPVVRNEFEMGENSPIQALDKQLWALAYQAHPYHHSTIGWRSDIEQVSIERLREFYDTFYWPNNATLTVLGDIDEKETLLMIENTFGKLASSPTEIPDIYTTEPPQEGTRYSEIRRAGNSSWLALGFKIPSMLHADIPALEVLAGALSRGKSSYFYKKLVENHKATEVEANVEAFRDGGLLTVYASVPADGSVHETEQALLESIAALKKAGVPKDLITRSRKQIQTGMLADRSSVLAIAEELNEWLAAGDWTQYQQRPSAVARISKQSADKVLRTYLDEKQMTVVRFYHE